MRFRQGLTVYQGDEAINAARDASGVVRLPKTRNHEFIDDPVRSGVRDRAFKTVAHLDTHLSIILRHQLLGQ